MESNLVKLLEVVIYLDKPNLGRNESIWVRETLSIDEITDKVNKKYKVWYTFDVDP